MADPKEEDVKVFVYPGQQPPYVFESKLLKAGVLTFKNENHPGFIINFNLMNADETNYYFPDNASNALAAAKLGKPGSDCPPQGTKWPEFKPVEVKNNNTTLVVHNENTDSADFGFTLFVTQEPHKPRPKYLPLDPIGSNQNGGRGFSLPKMATGLVVGAAAIAIAVVALLSFANWER
jgi:hypothetical protein